MGRIVLATLNARYPHAAFGLRYLLANLPEDLRADAEIVEFDINQRPTDIVERLLDANPRIIGLGVYIWNVGPTTQVVAELKRLRPGIVIVLGGPEVSHESESQAIVALADHTITGEADSALGALCRRILDGGTSPKIIAADLPDMAAVRLPYDLYTDADIAHRVIYVEASRGCPFHCEFCLSALDVPVRNVPLEPFLAAMEGLLERGATALKFVDRTFNLNVSVGAAILRFFLARMRPGLFLHFEMIPDRLPRELRELLAAFPAGTVQLEVGIQTFDPVVAARIGRRQDNAKVEENLRFLRAETGVHLHADLIAGLPGEDVGGFGAGFDRLAGLNPHEIQLGILKRLRGAPIARHDGEFAMVYSPHPPYEVLETGAMDFATIQNLRRMARHWDLLSNSGNYTLTLPMLWGDGSPFRAFWRLSAWLHETTGQRLHGIALHHLTELLFRYLTEVAGRDADGVRESLGRDYARNGRKDLPDGVRGGVRGGEPPARGQPIAAKTPARQARHLGEG